MAAFLAGSWIRVTYGTLCHTGLRRCMDYDLFINVPFCFLTKHELHACTIVKSVLNALKQVIAFLLLLAMFLVRSNVAHCNYVLNK